jgi:hypothetical protein
MELVQHDPLTIGVELAGIPGAYVMTCVEGVLVAFSVAGLVPVIGARAKNCPTPKRITIIKTTTRSTVFIFLGF